MIGFKAYDIKIRADRDHEYCGLSTLFKNKEYFYCPICLENFYTDQDSKLECGHFICDECLDKLQLNAFQDSLLYYCDPDKKCSCDRAPKKYVDRLETIFYKRNHAYFVNECPICKVCLYDENEKFIPLLLLFKYRYCHIVQNIKDIKFLKHAEIYKDLLSGFVLGMKHKRTVMMSIWFPCDDNPRFRFKCCYDNYDENTKKFKLYEEEHFSTYREEKDLNFREDCDNLPFFILLNYTKHGGLTKKLMESNKSLPALRIY